MDPLTGTLMGAGMSGIGGLLGGLLSRRRNQPSILPTVQRGIPGFSAYEMPGGTISAQLPRFTQTQQAGLEQLLKQGLSGLQQLPSADFGPIRKAAERQFQEQIVPGIAERFTGQGAQRSSAFTQALGSAGAGLSERLAGLEQEFNMNQRAQQQNLLMNLLGLGLGPRFQQEFIGGQPGFGAQFLGTLAPVLGQGISSLGLLSLMKYLQ
jgi:hypothetical protein